MQYKLCTYLQYDAMTLSYIQKDIQMIDNTYTMIIIISIGSFIDGKIKIYGIITQDCLFCTLSNIIHISIKQIHMHPNHITN